MTDPLERIERSMEVAKAYIKEKLPSHEIFPVPRDGYCIIHGFKEALLYVGWVVTFEELVEKLRAELTDRKPHYDEMLQDDVDILFEFEEYVKDP